ncbi:hypothetical protein [Natronomonas amylolytica]|uniref:hypothetical protein n=1 Tax=Natronomonas amylolytica TaxID=3108498 RepID=UPI00300B6ED2
MGLFDGLRRWWQRRFGSGADSEEDEAGSADTASESSEAGSYECAICGTTVEGPEASCPVCRSGDIVAADGRAADDQSSPASARQYVENTDDDPVQRLQQVRDSGEILDTHADRWEPTDDGFRVETPDGEVTVPSRVEVAALLEDHYE